MPYNVKGTVRPAIFLDRDGVLNEDKGYVYKPEDLLIPSGVADGLKTLKAHGYLLLVITNQSGVARGYFDLTAVNRFHAALAEALKKSSGVKLDGFYVCPHYPTGKVPPFNITCQCRKPDTGLIDEAIKEFPIDLKRSFLIGDKPSDIDCGLKAGIRAIQIAGKQYAVHPAAFARVDDFASAVEVILKSEA